MPNKTIGPPTEREPVQRVFVSEFVCGGGWPEGAPGGSLAREGKGMLAAVVGDFARIPGVRVTTTWDARLGESPLSGAQVIRVESPEDELPIFRELADLSNATLVIAPETHGLLEQRCRIVEGTRGRLLGPSSNAVQLCAGKLQTARHLEQCGIATIPTYPWRSGPDGRRDCPLDVLSTTEAMTFPLVVKPDDGAGSQSTWLIRTRTEFDELLPTLAADPLLINSIWQPLVAGRSVSVGLLISPDDKRIDALPVAEQTLSDDGRFRYLGGVLPSRNVDSAAIVEVAQEACRSIRDLRGYVGVDLLVPESKADRPIVVEINPRLTTSYLGYRQLTTENLAARMLFPSDDHPIVWNERRVEFSVQ